ncbi:MAG: protein phosphatase 2C domain-containing protein [Rikenellaceae bacterium]
MKLQLAQPLAIHELGKRSNQQDSIFPPLNKATADDRLFIVCDGMGGHAHGEVASATVCSALSQELLGGHGNLDSEDFTKALYAVYDVLDKLDDGSPKKMGTTMTCIKFQDGEALLAHIGDSRIYHIRPKERQILYKSRDHSLVNDLYAVGEITLEQMKTFPQRNIITRAMQPNQQVRKTADIHISEDIQAGDYFFMCTDGILEQLEDEHLLNILGDNKTSDKQKIKILERVTQDNRDNHSAYLIRVEQKKETIPHSTKHKQGRAKSSPLKIILITLVTIAALVAIYHAYTQFL